MRPPASGPVDRVRGVATGLLTAALAIAAHGAGGGFLPNGATMALLAVLASTAGAVAVTIPRADAPHYLLAILAVGQLLAHVLLGAAGHHHASTSTVAMITAHMMAVVAGAALIGACDRLWRALSCAVRAAVRVVAQVTVRPAAVVHRADQPPRSALLLAASVSHRGPPVSLAC
jgi:hypothetical protein